MVVASDFILCCVQSQRHWERTNIDLEAERQRLEEQWREATVIRESLVKEAATMKAIGTLVQSKTLKFDMSSMLKVSSMELSSSGMRPSSAAVGRGGGGDAAAQMRLGNLVKELQEQIQAQARQLQEKQGAYDRALRELNEEKASRNNQEEANKVH